jgi:hypothetical protein
MTATAQTETDSATGYKALLLQARALRGKAGTKAFDRAAILVKVFEDGEFRQDCGNLDDFRAAELLDEYVEDLALGFLDLRAMLAHYPRRRQWAEGRLSKMLREMVRAKEKALPVAARPPRVAIAETRKQLEQQLEVARREKAKIEYARKDEIGHLKARIAELEAENAELRARIEALEGSQCEPSRA